MTIKAFTQFLWSASMIRASWAFTACMGTVYLSDSPTSPLQTRSQRCTHVHGHTREGTHTQTQMSKAAAYNHYNLLNEETEKCFQILNVSAGSVRCRVPLTYKRHLNATNSPFLQHINLQFGDEISLHLPLWLPTHQSSPCPNWVSAPLLLGPYRITLSNWPALPHKTMRQELDKSY